MSNYRENILFIKVQKIVCNIIDFFYPPFARLMPKHTFRYLASGGSAFIFDIIIYFISYNFILQKQDVNLGFVTISAPIFAFLMSFLFINPYSFLMSKFVVFQGSNLKGKIQAFRYIIIVGINIFLNYALMKILVEWLEIYPTPSRIITAVAVAIFSFFAQQYFTFGTSNNEKKVRKV